jgi:hypothetical protein
MVCDADLVPDTRQVVRRHAPALAPRWCVEFFAERPSETSLDHGRSHRAFSRAP